MLYSINHFGFYLCFIRAGSCNDSDEFKEICISIYASSVQLIGVMIVTFK
jgi:hypothetical protein